MQHTDSSPDHVSSPGWELLGELKLTVNPDTNYTVNKWLAVILNPLQLHADFLSKVLKSAQDATARAMQAKTVVKSQHTHLLIFVPADRVSNGHNWGFFRIEKVGNASKQDYPDHSIEFYLYEEG